MYRLSPQTAAALSASCPPQQARTSAAATPPVLAAAGAGLLAPLRAGASIMRAAADLLSRIADPPGGTAAQASDRDQRNGGPTPEPERLDPAWVTPLVYELLDALMDTAELAADLEHEPAWSAHLSYLCALQRHGREALAQIGTGTGA